MNMREMFMAGRFGGGSGGGASSWNDLTDKPFGEEKAFEPIVWDGNTEGLESLDMGGGMMFYRVSDDPITDPASIDSLVMTNANESGSVTYKAEEVGVTIQPFGFMMRTYLMSVAEDTNLGDGDGAGVIAKGLWLMSMNGTFFSAVNPKTTLKTLDEKYLPESVKGGGGGGADLLDENGIIKQEYLPEGFPYKSGEDVVIMPSTTLTADPESGAFAVPEVVNKSELFDGMRCVVTLEGIGAYEAICRGFPPENEMGVQFALGNLAYLGLGDDTGEPLCVALMAPEIAAEMGFAGVMSVPSLAVESLTVSISGFKGTFATIDPGYLPTVETVIVKVAGDIENDDYTTSHTTKEVDSLLRLGNVVMVEYRKTANELARDYYQLGSWLPDISASFYPIRPVQATEPRTIIANISNSDNSGNNWQAYYD